MLIRRRHPNPRRGTATVEMAVVMSLVIVPLMLGLWEMGRLVQVQQVVSNAAREGARLAAQARTIKLDPNTLTFNVKQITAADVQRTVYEYLVAAGVKKTTGGTAQKLQPTDVATTFTFIDPPAATEPHQGEKNQRFRVTVTMQFAQLRWINLGIVKPETVSYSVDWQMLVDDPYQVAGEMPGPPFASH